MSTTRIQLPNGKLDQKVRTLNNGLEDQTVVLRSRDVNPFNGWSDWYGADGEAVVTFETIQHHLYSRWEAACVSFDHSQCDHGDSLEDRLEEDEETGHYVMKDCNSERVVDHDQFDAEEVKAPGVYRDGTHYDTDGSVDESYTIIVPYPFLSPELCRAWIQKLNEEFDRDFELAITEEQKRQAGGWEDLGVNRMDLSGNDDGRRGDGEWFPVRKKPVKVDARGPYDSTDELETLEGDFEVDTEYIEKYGGYYIIRGVEGEVYPCRKDIFKQTYDRVDDR